MVPIALAARCSATAPPWASTMPLITLIPRPVPGTAWRAAFEARKNRWNRSRLLALRDADARVRAGQHDVLGSPRSWPHVDETRPRAGVNFTALLRMFRSASSRWRASPTTRARAARVHGQPDAAGVGLPADRRDGALRRGPRRPPGPRVGRRPRSSIRASSSRSSISARSRSAFSSTTPSSGRMAAGHLAGRAVADQVQVADDRGQRRPQLVGDGGQEVVLAAVQVAQLGDQLALLLVQRRVDDRPAEVGGHPLCASAPPAPVHAPRPVGHRPGQQAENGLPGADRYDEQAPRRRSRRRTAARPAARPPAGPSGRAGSSPRSRRHRPSAASYGSSPGIGISLERRPARPGPLPDDLLDAAVTDQPEPAAVGAPAPARSSPARRGRPPGPAPRARSARSSLNVRRSRSLSVCASRHAGPRRPGR